MRLNTIFISSIDVSQLDKWALAEIYFPIDFPSTQTTYSYTISISFHYCRYSTVVQRYILPSLLKIYVFVEVLYALGLREICSCDRRPVLAQRQSFLHQSFQFNFERIKRCVEKNCNCKLNYEINYLWKINASIN